MAGRKTLSFALIHFSVAFTVTTILTGSPTLGGLIALIEPLVNTVAYYLHEQAWLRWPSRHLRRDDAQVSPVGS
ncbi:MAG: DUF2061 domain-containing protein [Xanthomonadales bacterium]|nr:DUF2061 domain-containing protein [Xanthomonadales bacterium]